MDNQTYIGTILTIFMSFAIMTAMGQENNKSPLCENKLALLTMSRNDKFPVTNHRLFVVRDSICEIINNTFEDNCSHSFRFSVKHRRDSLIHIDLPLTAISMAQFDCGCNEILPPHPPINALKHGIFVHPTMNDTIYIMKSQTFLTSLQEQIIERYHSIPTQFYDRIHFSLYWRTEINEERFNTAINECFNGYLAVADQFSIQEYGRSICELDHEKIKSLSYLIPLNVFVWFLGEEYDHLDFVPWGLAPAPPEEYFDE